MFQVNYKFHPPERLVERQVDEERCSFVGDCQKICEYVQRAPGVRDGLFVRTANSRSQVHADAGCRQGQVAQGSGHGDAENTAPTLTQG